MPIVECPFFQTAGISFRAFYRVGTEPLPMDLEKLIRGIENLIVSESRRHGSSLIG